LQYFHNLYNVLHKKDGDKLAYYGKTEHDLYNDDNRIIEKLPLSSIPEKPLLMMSNQFEIAFDHTPSAPGTYEFTVKFTFGPDPLSGETVDIAPAKVSIEF